MGDRVEYVTTYWVEDGTLVQHCDTLEGCDLIHERIVRCRDCRYHAEFTTRNAWSGKVYKRSTCEREEYMFDVKPNDFCSWGKSRR